MAERYHQRARRLILDEIELIARKVLTENPEYVEFIMAHGTHFITTKEQGLYCVSLTTSNVFADCDEHDYKKIKEVTDILLKWDETYGLTKESIRFTHDGPVVTNW